MASAVARQGERQARPGRRISVPSEDVVLNKNKPVIVLRPSPTRPTTGPEHEIVLNPTKVNFQSKMVDAEQCRHRVAC